MRCAPHLPCAWLKWIACTPRENQDCKAASWCPCTDRKLHQPSHHPALWIAPQHRSRTWAAWTLELEERSEKERRRSQLDERIQEMVYDIVSSSAHLYDTLQSASTQNTPQFQLNRVPEASSRSWSDCAQSETRRSLVRTALVSTRLGIPLPSALRPALSQFRWHSTTDKFQNHIRWNPTVWWTSRE